MTWNDWNPYRGVSIWQIVVVGAVCLAFIAFGDCFILHRHNREETKRYRYRKVWIAFVAFYVFTILCATYLGREASEPKMQLRLFWTIRAALKTGDWKYWYFIVGNILLFVPLGFLFCNLFRGKWRWKWSVFLCLIFSCSIEAMQYFTGTGLCELDDVFHNTLGGGIGVLLNWIGKRKENAIH